jgi:hypothetical protein
MVDANQKSVSLLLVCEGELSLVSDKERFVGSCVTQSSRQCRSGFKRWCSSSLERDRERSELVIDRAGVHNSDGVEDQVKMVESRRARRLPYPTSSYEFAPWHKLGQSRVLSFDSI